MGSEYMLYVKNAAATGVTEFCIYQPAPDPQTTMAWYVTPVAAGVTMRVPCLDDLDFVWIETDKIGEATVTEWQSIPASTTYPGQSEAVLDFTDGAFVIAPGTAVPDPLPGTLYVATTGAVPGRRALTGIGRSGRPLFTVPAGPNMVASFTLHDAPYRVAAAAPGTFTAGAALPIAEVTQYAEVTFDANDPVMTAMWDGSTWAVSPGPPPVTA
jgi:hypothetical protein